MTINENINERRVLNALRTSWDEARKVILELDPDAAAYQFYWRRADDPKITDPALVCLTIGDRRFRFHQDEVLQWSPVIWKSSPIGQWTRVDGYQGHGTFAFREDDDGNIYYAWIDEYGYLTYTNKGDELDAHDTVLLIGFEPPTIVREEVERARAKLRADDLEEIVDGFVYSALPPNASRELITQESLKQIQAEVGEFVARHRDDLWRLLVTKDTEWFGLGQELYWVRQDPKNALVWAGDDAESVRLRTAAQALGPLSLDIDDDGVSSIGPTKEAFCPRCQRYIAVHSEGWFTQHLRGARMCAGSGVSVDTVVNRTKEDWGTA